MGIEPKIRNGILLLMLPLMIVLDWVHYALCSFIDWYWRESDKFEKD